MILYIFFSVAQQLKTELKKKEDLVEFVLIWNLALKV